MADLGETQCTRIAGDCTGMESVECNGYVNRDGDGVVVSRSAGDAGVTLKGCLSVPTMVGRIWAKNVNGQAQIGPDMTGWAGQVCQWGALVSKGSRPCRDALARAASLAT
jgi:hypothetical protein